MKIFKMLKQRKASLKTSDGAWLSLCSKRGSNSTGPFEISSKDLLQQLTAFENQEQSKTPEILQKIQSFLRRK